MKKSLFIVGAVTLMLVGFASQSFAGMHVNIGFFAHEPAYVVPAPVTVYDPVYERARPVVIEEPAYYRVPAEYPVVHERWYRDCDRWDRDRYWSHDDWRRGRAERHWREKHWDRDRDED